MAMDKNDKVNLFRKVPKIAERLLIEPLERLAFLDIQIFERKKVIYRDLVDIEKYKFLADQDDQTAVQVAEGNTPESITHLKGLKLEVEALEKIRTDLVNILGPTEVNEFYTARKGTDYPIPADWLKKNS